MADNATILNSVSETGGQTSQTIFVADLISEGPIQGLVDGEASVFLDDTRIKDIGDSSYESVASGRTVSFSGTTGTVSGGSWLDTDKGPNTPTESGDKFLRLYSTVEISGVTLVPSSTGGTTGLITLTMSGADFSPIQTGTLGNRRVRLKNDDGTKVEGTSIWGSVTGSAFITQISEVAGFDYDGSTYTMCLDETFPIASINYGATATIVTTTAPPVGAYVFAVGPEDVINSSIYSLNKSPDKYEQTTVQFRDGQLHQKPLDIVGGVGNSAIAGVMTAAEVKQVASTPFPTDGYSDGFSADGTDIVIQALGGSGNRFGLSAAQVKEVDELRFNIAYPALVKVSGDTGRESETSVMYKVVLTVDGTPFTLYGDGQTAGEKPPLLHTAKTNGPISFGHSISLESFGPRDDFFLTITRLTRHEGWGVQRDGSNTNKRYSHNSIGSVTGVNSVIKELFTYPYTAYAGLTFSSKEFQNMPQRTYHVQGMKVKVPSNYTTREASATGESDYTGVWDGTFKDYLEYTDNPAWIFHDIITNNRYGAGQWIEEDQISKYALYRIARYCDELVDDGNGGLEPRFRSNLYLTKGADVYKVLKDMSTMFLGMLYWMDGQVVPNIDQPNDPVYNFTKSNVIGGTFNYETTGNKTRVNQVVVTWNNPEAGYKLEPLIVEDRDAILDSGRIMSQNAVAFGCTSEGQAIRYGRWKLWTAQNQTELISFQSALNVGFLKPGDVINVQDFDRYKSALSGRLQSEDSLANPISTTRLPLDREITFAYSHSYEVSVLFTESSTILVQDTATIGSVVYTNGDELPFARGYTEAQASTILDDSSDLVAVAYNETSRVETGVVTNPAGTYDYILVSAGLSAVPAVQGVYSVTENQDLSGVDTVTSAKQYRIISSAETAKNIYAIVAIEHYNVKYAAVDKDYNLGDIPDAEFPPKGLDDAVSPPSNVYLLRNSSHKWEGDELAIRFDPPADDYAFVAGYEITHDLLDQPNPIPLPKWGRGWLFPGVPNGHHVFGVRTVATDGDRSRYVVQTMNVDDPYDADTPKTAEGVSKGGYCTTNLYIKNDTLGASNVLTFEDPEFEFSPIQDPNTDFLGDEAIPSTYSLSVDNIVVQGSANPDFFESWLGSFHIFYDHSAGVASNNPWKLLWWDFISIKNLYVWQDYNAPSQWTPIGGTVTIAKNTIVVDGVGTSFQSTLEVGDVLKLSDGFDALGAKVVGIPSDTRLYIDRSFEVDITNYAATEQALKIDHNTDCIIARVWKPFGFQAGDTVKLTSFLNAEVSSFKPNMSTGYLQTTAPIDGSPYDLYVNDVWFDTNSNPVNQQDYWNGSSWVSREIDPWSAALFNIENTSIQTTGRSHLFIQDNEPIERNLLNYAQGDRLGVGDTWVDSGFNNTSYEWNGSAWVGKAVNSTANAVYVQPTAPTGGQKGDQWYDDDNNLEQFVHTDGIWQRVTSESPGASLAPIVLVFSGQSNCTGWGAIDPGWTANNQVFDWTTGGSGGVHSWQIADLITPKADFDHGGTPVLYTGLRGGADNAGWRAANYLQQITGREVYIITTHKGGESINAWAAAGSAWVELRDQVEAARTAIPGGYSGAPVSHFLWFQGESDSTMGTTEYITKFDSLIDRTVTETWHFPGLMTIDIFQLVAANRVTSFHNATFDALNHGRPEYLRVVNNGYMASADVLHFDGDSLALMGVACGESLAGGISSKTMLPRGMPLSWGDTPAAWASAAFVSPGSTISVCASEPMDEIMRFTHLDSTDSLRAEWTLDVDPEAGSGGSLILSRATGEIEGTETNQLFYARVDMPGISMANVSDAVPVNNSWEISPGDIFASNALIIAPVGTGNANVLLAAQDTGVPHYYNFYKFLDLPYTDFAALAAPGDAEHDNKAAPKGYVDALLGTGFVDLTTAQDIAGLKTFNNLLTAQQGISVAGDIDTFNNVTAVGTFTSTIGQFILTAAQGADPDALTKKSYVDDNFVDLTTTETIGGLKSFSSYTNHLAGLVITNTTDAARSWSFGAALIAGVDNSLLIAPSDHESAVTIQTKTATAGTLSTFLFRPDGSLQLPSIEFTGDVLGTGSGTIATGVGDGSVGMTINDGQGNANITFNHIDGVADKAGNCARIVVNTDATTGATMDFELLSNATAGATSTISYATFSELAQQFVRPQSTWAPVAADDLCNKTYVDAQVSTGAYVDLTTTQTIAGDKSFSNIITANKSGTSISAAADIDTLGALNSVGNITSSNGSATALKGRFTATTDVSLSSTGHALQLGVSGGANIAMDTNEIMARNNGAAAALYLNNQGGIVLAGAGGFQTTGIITAQKAGTSISAAANIDTLGNMNAVGNISCTAATVTGLKGRFTATTDLSATSTGHAFQTGSTTGINIGMSGNEIMARSNGATSTLYINWNGGPVLMGANCSVGSALSVGTTALGTSGQIRATGNITAYYSDERLKDITEWMTPDTCLSNVMTWRPVKYTAKDWTPWDSSVVEVGLLAQDIEETTPEAVAPAPFDENYKTLHYERLIPELVGSIQELKRELDQLRKDMK